MLFNSFEFALFFPIVTLLYFALPHRGRWALLLAASCIFYMAFVPVYIVILGVTILIDYWAAIWIEDTPSRKKSAFLLASVVATCAVLFVFKYYDFYVRNVDALMHLVGWNYSPKVLHILLPIGLSFHTFQSLSYVIEVYRGNQKAERHFGIYSLYVMFYPQLVAGPIERPQNLLHQFHEFHSFDSSQFASGLRQMAWGFFKKLVIADRLAIYVNEVYGAPEVYSGPHLVLATVFFAYQIYCDFSGYSDIAIGSARVMGFKLMNNFDRPYCAKSVSEFWRRWHISLSTWFRDYVYIPLGGNRAGNAAWYRNLLITFGLSGLWHGANWTFILWGILNGVYLVVGAATVGARDRIYRSMGLDPGRWPVSAWRTVFTFCLICAGWILFRADNLQDAKYIFTHLFDMHGFSRIQTGGFNLRQLTVALIAIVVLEVIQGVKDREFYVRRFFQLPRPIRWATYYAMLFVTALFGVYSKSQFIYFQF